MEVTNPGILRTTGRKLAVGTVVSTVMGSSSFLHKPSVPPFALFLVSGRSGSKITS